MSKIIEVTQEIDQHLVKIFDQALKAGGLALHNSVQAVIQAIRELDIPPTKQ
jgi:hypothetical protein